MRGFERSTCQQSPTPSAFLLGLTFLCHLDLQEHLEPRSVCASSVAQSCQTLWPCRLWPARLLCPRNFPGKNTGVGSHFRMAGDLPGPLGIFLDQRSNPCLLRWQAGSLPLSHLRSPKSQFTHLSTYKVISSSRHQEGKPSNLLQYDPLRVPWVCTWFSKESVQISKRKFSLKTVKTKHTSRAEKPH